MNLTLLDGAAFVPPAPFPTVSRDHVMLIGAPDALRATYEDICGVPVPDATHRENTGNVSYQPLPYKDLADATRSICSEMFGVSPLSESYALARRGEDGKGGDQMFGKIVFPLPYSDRHGLSIALRSSYDRSISNQVAAGMDTFVCANGCFSGDAMLKLKHTMNVCERLPGMMREMAARAGGKVREMAEKLDSWGDVSMTDTLFAAYVGILVYRKDITPTQGNTAIKYWRACRAGELHAEHSAPTLASGFQAITGGLQRAAPARVFQQFSAVDFVTTALARTGGSMDTDIPAFSLEIEEYE